MKKITITLLAAAMVAIACKPSVKNETNKYNNYIKDARTLAVSYPRYAKYINEATSKAQAEYTTAQSIENEEEKAEALKAANEHFKSGVMNKLTQVLYKSKSIDDSIKSLNKKKLTTSQRRDVNAKIIKARKKQSEARGLLYGADTSTEESALAAAKEAISKLISANSDISAAKKLARKK